MKRAIRTSSMASRPRWPAALCCTAFGAGCADGATIIEPTGAAERAESAAVVAILTPAPDDSFQTYLLASEQAPSGTLDLSGALERPDALVTQNDQAIFVGDNSKISLQRFEVNVDYSFT